MPPEQNNRSWIIGKKRVEKKMTSSTTKEFEKASLGEGSNGVVGKTHNEKGKLDMVLWDTSQIMR